MRFVPLYGASNFRDFGGYPGAGGRTIRWRRLFRSNKLSGLSEADGARLDSLGVRTVFDLRARAEREADPTAWSHPTLQVRTYRPGHKRRLVDMALEYPPTLEGVQALMHDFYAEMPFTMAHVFGEIIREVAQGASPCLVHCSAGKDRTGMAAALLQAALGAGREAIVADYELTNARPRPISDMARAVTPDARGGDLRARYPPEAIEAMMAADPAYIGAALDAIEARHGSLAGFIQEGLGVDAATVARLRTELLED